MTHEELMQLRREGPFDHEQYTVWLHNKIVDKINYEIWNFKEQKAIGLKSGYAAVVQLMDLPSLNPIQ